MSSIRGAASLPVQPGQDSRQTAPSIGTGKAGPQTSSSSPQSDGNTAHGARDSKLPTVKPPSGGGSLHGMGEKFAVQPATGTSSFDVPLPTTPGRADHATPQLSLSYSSGAGNGPFGLGWSLAGLAHITRRTDKGLPRYDDAHNSDVFILAGAEDLVPVAEASTRSGIYDVRRYRPRVEGLFARIEKLVNTTDSGDVFWRVITSDNTTSIFGRDHSSRICSDSSGANRIFSWLLSETYDCRGNAISYVYKSEDGRAIDLTVAHEQNRSVDGRNTQRYIKSIRYGNRTPNRSLDTWELVTTPLSDIAAPNWCFELVFDYGEHNVLDPKPDDAGSWICRQDPFSVFRAGFEVRTYRLCRRILMFHRFPTELGTDVLLVGGLELSYEQTSAFSFLTKATARGFTRRDVNSTLPPGPGPFFSRSLPPVEFQYSPAPSDETLSALIIEEVDTQTLRDAPSAMMDNLNWVDLFGEGLEGLFADSSGGAYYKRNFGATSPVNVQDGTVQGASSFGSLELLADMPNTSISNGSRFMDLAGDGAIDIVSLSGSVKGFYAAKRDSENASGATWSEFQPFASWPNEVDVSNPNLKFVDLSGDGLADILITEDDILYYPSLGSIGYGQLQRVPGAADEDKGPRVLLADAEESIHLADLSGDGTLDLCRIRNGHICYWPNIGYGQFGAKVTMDNAPFFDNDNDFNHRQLLLCDIDGSGTTDLIYIGNTHATIYLNEAGNSWSQPKVLSVPLPPGEVFPSITTTDLLGNGTTCLVWASSTSGDSRTSIRYVDFNGRLKPHLLVRTLNNIGKETRLSYLPSTTFYLRDKFNGKPWVTRLPYAVQCLERVQTFDAVSHSYQTSRYAYHHGYFDPYDREFRGFGMVEQWDTEDFDFLDQNSPAEVANVDGASYVPPVLTKRWYHTGAYADHDQLQRQYAKEYFSLSGLSTSNFEQYYSREVLKDSIVGMQDLTGEEQREASRALKGVLLRQEVYAQDGSEMSLIPFSITDNGHNIAVMQRRGNNDSAICYPFRREELEYFSERTPSDCRLKHEMTLSVDDFGNTTRSASIWYGRTTGNSNLSGRAKAIQETTKISYTEREYTNFIDDATNHQNPLVSSSKTFELTGLRPSNGTTFHIEEFSAEIIENFETIPHETSASETTQQKRLVANFVSLYRKNDMTGLLKLGEIQSLGLVGLSYSLCFTPDILAKYNRKGQDLLPDAANVLGKQAGYVDLNNDGNCWMPTSQTFFHSDPSATPETELQQARHQFFMVARNTDPLNHSATVAYDGNVLCIVRQTDGVGNTGTIEWDYRTMKPRMMVDPNKNRTAFAYDCLGLLVATAVMGKADDSPAVGDSLVGVQIDLSDDVVKAFFLDPLANKSQLIGNATHRYVYDLDQYMKSSPGTANPSVTANLRRETHVSDALSGMILVSMTYSDGYGRQIQSKDLAEPDPITPTKPRWIGSNWTVFNNKGSPVRIYKPFFDDTHSFKSDHKSGIASIYVYDAMERLTVVIMPDKSWTKHVYRSWGTTVFDSNDTVLGSPKSDPDVGHLVSRLPDLDVSPTWYEQRKDGALGIPEQNAAQKAALHNQTPSSMEFDPLGRAFFTIEHNGGNERFTTLTVSDILGREMEEYDAQDRLIERNAYNMLGMDIRSESMDSGEHWVLPDVLGQDILSWNSRGMQWRTMFDELGRETARFLKSGTDKEVLYMRHFYGEAVSNPEEFNLRGELYQVCDQSGIQTNGIFDFKGNVLAHTTQLAQSYNTVLDWIDVSKVALEPDVYAEFTSYNALNQVVAVKTPDETMVRYRHNERLIIGAIQVNMKGVEDKGGSLTWDDYVVSVNYNEFAKPTRVLLGNGCQTQDTYDGLTDRLVSRRTAAPGTRGWTVIQNVEYTYDPVGSIVAIRNKAQQDVFFRNNVVTPDSEYTYDAIYRLIQATGREQLGQTDSSPGAPVIPSAFQDFSASRDQPGDGSAMGRYVESYTYDSTNNVLSVKHESDDSRRQGWTRTYTYGEPSFLEPEKKCNRLSSTSIGSVVEKYGYQGDGGEHGNITSMPHLSVMEWDAMDQLRQTARQVVGEGNQTPERTWYVYNGYGVRVRKVTERQGQAGGTPRKLKERVYLGGYEIYKKYSGTDTQIIVQSVTVHVRGDDQTIALVEDWTGGKSPGRLIRYQFADHLDTVAIEVDEHNVLVSYEEYTPYGNTTYQLQRSEQPKRYRWTGKERDGENGFYYHDARYYAPWLARWISPDPIGIEDDINVYGYVSGNPLTYSDPTGLGKRNKKQKRGGKLKTSGRLGETTRPQPATKLKGKQRERALQFAAGKPAPVDKAALAQGVKRMAKGLKAKVEELDLHHVYPQEKRAEFAKIGILIDNFTLAVTKPVHNVVTNGVEKAGIPKWNNEWKERFFATKQWKKFAKLSEAEQATANTDSLRNKAQNVAGTIMAMYGFDPQTDKYLHYSTKDKPDKESIKMANLAHDKSWTTVDSYEAGLKMRAKLYGGSSSSSDSDSSSSSSSEDEMSESESESSSSSSSDESDGGSSTRSRSRSRSRSSSVSTVASRSRSPSVSSAARSLKKTGGK